MKRTSSGNNLAAPSLYEFAAATPYVHMSAQTTLLPSPNGRGTMLPADEAPTFCRHCAGGTVRQLQTSTGVAFALPPGFNVDVAGGGYLTATGLPWQGSEPILSVPLASVLRASVLRSSGQDASMWQILCGCCFGERDVLLALDIDAPVGWLQMSGAPVGCVGPVRLSLHVRDVDEWIDAMDIHLLLEPSPAAQ